jgi:hypothetical protein
VNLDLIVISMPWRTYPCDMINIQNIVIIAKKILCII